MKKNETWELIKSRFPDDYRQSDIAHALGVSTSAVNAWAKGKAKPREVTLRRLAGISAQEYSRSVFNPLKLLHSIPEGSIGGPKLRFNKVLELLPRLSQMQLIQLFQRTLSTIEPCHGIVQDLLKYASETAERINRPDVVKGCLEVRLRLLKGENRRGTQRKNA